MSVLNRAISIKRNLSHPLRLVLISALFASLLLAIFASTASAQSNNVIGRGFTGAVISVDTSIGLLTISSKEAFFQIVVNDSTVINNPPEENVGLDGLPTRPNFRVAGLVDKAITDADGVVRPEFLTAQKITVIPGRATRKHKRTLAADKDGDSLTILHNDGTKTDLPGRGAGFDIGDSIIMLVQSSGRDGAAEKVRALFKARVVDDRLDRFSKAAADDPRKADLLASLRDRHEDARVKRLQKTAENAGAAFRDFVQNNVRTFKENKEARLTDGGTGQAVSECARNIAGSQAVATDKCPNTTEPVVDESPVIRITSPTSGTIVSANDVVTVTAEAKDDLGVVSVTFNVAGSDRAALTETPYTVDVTIPTGVSSVQIKATAVDTGGNEATDAITLLVARAADVGVKITSPVAGTSATAAVGTNSRRSTISGSNEAIAEGDTINIRAEVSGTGTVTVVFTLNGVDQTPISAPPYSMTYFVPLTLTTEDLLPLIIAATATDGSGNTASDSVSVTITRKTTVPNVKITNPLADAKVKGGDTIVIRAETGEDSKIAFVTFSIDGKETVTTAAPFTHTHTVPVRSTAAAAVSSLPPNVFVGKATLDGAPAPDDTVVIAWIAGSDAITLSIKVTATANSGVTGSASLSLPVSNSINAGETVVKDGEYVLNAAQPSGQSFAGKTVTFTVGGKDVRQSATWKQGGADILDLTAN